MVQEESLCCSVLTESEITHDAADNVSEFISVPIGLLGISLQEI